MRSKIWEKIAQPTMVGIALIGSLLMPLSSLADELIKDLTAALTFEVDIKAPPEKVYPYLLDASQWKYSVRESQFVGDVTTIGSITKVFQGESTEPSLLIKTVRAVENERYGFSIHVPTGQFVGFAEFELEPTANGSHLTYRIFFYMAAPEGMNKEDREKILDQIVSEMENRQPIELNTLKELVEKLSRPKIR